MPVTEIPQLEEQFRHTSIQFKEVKSMPTGKTLSSRNTCYFTITDFGFPEVVFKPSYYLTPIDPLSISEKQFNLIGLSKELFKNAKHLGGPELAVLNKTYSRLFSKTPTRLK